MPFVFDEEQIEWPEDAGDDYEPPPPLPEQFEYLPPPDFGGAREPVRFAAPTPGQGTAVDAAPRPKRPLKLRIVDWLLAKWFKDVDRMIAEHKSRERQAEERRQQLFELMLPALRDMGALRVRCVYDGGNDEGFAWFGTLETDEESLSADEVTSRLAGTGLREKLVDVGYLHEHPDHPRSEEEQLKEIIDYTLPEEWAVLLLGWGFGTGPFSMYGAFTVDLHQCTITDDREADVPENGNIEIGGRDD